MKIYDVSVPISPEMPVYPGDPAIHMELSLSISKGDPCNVTHYSFGSHVGTHIDAPFHFIDGGLKVEDIPINLLIGRTRVVEFTAARIDADLLKEVDLGEHVRVIFKTRNSYLWSSNRFVEDYVYVTPEAAEILVESGIKLVGIDYLSIEQYRSTDFPTHQTLLSNGVIIIEGLNLAEVEPGDYELICLPLKVKNGDGAPARVILRK
ncbi:MAG: cyclase family protein [Acidobacteriota bacterium]